MSLYYSWLLFWFAFKEHGSNSGPVTHLTTRGPIALSMVSANNWFRSIETLWYWNVSLVIANIFPGWRERGPGYETGIFLIAPHRYLYWLIKNESALSCFQCFALFCCNEPILFLISKTFSQSLGFFFSHISACFRPFFAFSKFLYIIPTTIGVRTTLANENKKKLKPNNGCTRTNCELQGQWQHHILKISLVEPGKISVLYVEHAL